MIWSDLMKPGTFPIFPSVRRLTLCLVRTGRLSDVLDFESVPCFPTLSTLVLKKKRRGPAAHVACAGLIALVHQLRGEGGALKELLLQDIEIDGDIASLRDIVKSL